jgi:hypothetical protein
MSIWRNVGDSLLFRTTSLVVLRDRSDVFQRGLLVLVAISLIVGLVNSAITSVRDVQDPSPERAFEQARAGFRQGMEQARTTMDIPPKIEGQIEEYFEAGLDMGLAIARLPLRIAQPAGVMLSAVGRLLSAPFDWLGGWMFYALLVAIAAHLMGGKASVRQMLGLTAFYAVPHLLDVIPPLLGLVPVAGPALQFFTGAVIGVGTWVWGVLIYIAAASVASEFDWARGALAVLAPVLLVGALVLLAGIAGLLALLL